MSSLLSASALNSVIASANALWSTGSGDSGYGQTTIPSVAAGQLDYASGLTGLSTALTLMCNWQGVSITTGLIPSFVTGKQATVPSIASLISMLTAGRLTSLPANMSLTSAQTSTRNSAWGNGNTSITCSFAVTFASADQARYFFNTGGQLRVSLAHPSTATSQDTAWNAALSNVVIALGADTSTKISGATGTAENLGYYQLTSTAQTVLSGSGVFSGAYSSDYYTVSASMSGNVVTLTVLLDDAHTNSYYDSVASGTYATLSLYQPATGLPTLPAVPTTAITASF